MGASTADTIAHPLAVVRRLRDTFHVEKVLVGVSCGKDSIATLALCVEHFGHENVLGFFMYMVPNLAFQENYLQYIERRFNISILRIPHWMLSLMYRENTLRHPTAKSRNVKRVYPRDVDNYLRAKTGIQWIATGEKCRDSLERNAMIKKAGGIDVNRHRCWPIASWSHAAVFNFLKSRNVALPPEYRSKDYASSFGCLWYRDLVPIREHFPEDWERVKKHFPLVESQILRYQLKTERAAREAAAAELTLASTEGEIHVNGPSRADSAG